MHHDDIGLAGKPPPKRCDLLLFNSTAAVTARQDQKRAGTALHCATNPVRPIFAMHSGCSIAMSRIQFAVWLNSVSLGSKTIAITSDNVCECVRARVYVSDAESKCSMKCCFIIKRELNRGILIIY